MFNRVNYALLALLAVAARTLYFGASVGEALVIFALASLYGFGQYLDSQKEEPVNDQIKAELKSLHNEVNTLRDAVGGLKIAKTFNKLG